jgi:NAD(P)H-flavin reductase
LEFLVKDPGVEGSTAAIICSLGKGDKVELSQVLGNGFKVEQLEPPEEYQTVLLFATGSGISPIRSLIEAGFGADERSDVRLYYGARNLERMAYQEKFKEWEASGIQVVPVLSQPGSDWSGAQGYVQAFFSKNTGIANGAQTGALLCGHKAMAQDVTELLLADGVSKDKILLNF